MVIEISELGALFLSELSTASDWLSRAEIARRINRPHNLYAYDVRVLNELIQAGLVEVTQIRTGAVKKEYRYRLTDAGKVQLKD